MNATRVSANRYIVFFLLAAGALGLDVYSKAFVFDDLGYFPGGGRQTAKVGGQHAQFDSPAGREGETVPYIDGWVTFRLYTSFNHGALWGFGQGFSSGFAVLSVVAVIGVLCWLFVFRAAESWWLTTALAFITGGTLGNLYDRLGLHGCMDVTGEQELRAVRDFFLFTFGDFAWPIFNIADICLVTGAIMLVLQSFSSTQIAHVEDESTGDPAPDLTKASA